MLKAMILSAGEGTRLRPLTLALPKPMVPLVHVPLLERTVRLLHRQGIDAIAVNLHHHGDRIRDHFGTTLTYSDEPVLRGTAGALTPLAAFFDTTVVVLYGDNLYDFELGPLLARHRAVGARATLATFTTDQPTRCGLVVTDSHGVVTRFQEKPPADQVFTNQANAGVYLLEPEIVAHLPTTLPCDFGHDVFPCLLRERPGTLYAFPLEGYLRDTGTPENYRQASWDLLARSEEGLHPTAHLAAGVRCTGRNVVGAGCTIGAGCHLEESILWENGTIGSGVHLSGCILGNGVTIDAGALVAPGTILAPGTHIAGAVAR